MPARTAPAYIKVRGRRSTRRGLNKACFHSERTRRSQLLPTIRALFYPIAGAVSARARLATMPSSFFLRVVRAIDRPAGNRHVALDDVAPAVWQGRRHQIPA